MTTLPTPEEILIRVIAGQDGYAKRDGSGIMERIVTGQENQVAKALAEIDAYYANRVEHALPPTIDLEAAGYDPDGLTFNDSDEARIGWNDALAKFRANYFKEKSDERN